MGRYWAISLWIILQKIAAVLVAIGSVWAFIELERVAAQGIRELSFIGIVVSTDVGIAIQIAPFAILIRGLLASLLLYATAQFIGLLTDLMVQTLQKLRGSYSAHTNYTPPIPENDAYLARPDFNRPTAWQDERAAAVRARGKWDVGKS